MAETGSIAKCEPLQGDNEDRTAYLGDAAWRAALAESPIADGQTEAVREEIIERSGYDLD